MDRIRRRIRRAAARGAAAGLAALSACRSPLAHRQQADETAARTIAERQEALYGGPVPFTIERPADRLRLRLIEEQGLPVSEIFRSPPPTPPDRLPDAPLRLGLEDALRAGAWNHAELQAAKEAIFRTALELDLARERFRAGWPALLGLAAVEDRGADPPLRGLEGRAAGGPELALRSGAQLTSRLALDLVKLLTLDRDSAYGLIADVGLTLPLLRGAGRAVLTEPLTQAERDVAYAMYEYDRLRQTFAVRVARDYFAALEQEQKVRNAQDNVERLGLAVLRAERLAEAGRQGDLFVHQARQDRLRAEDRLLAAQQILEQRLDALKSSLGLPADARIEPDPAELVRITRPLDRQFEPGTAPEPDDEPISQSERLARDLGWTEAGLLRLALDTRRDLIVAQGRHEDARRSAGVAADALRAGLQLEVAGRAGGGRTLAAAAEGNAPLRPGEGRATARLEWSPPWDRAPERVAYRQALLAADAALRAAERAEDAVKLEVRDSLRTLLRARENCRIQREAVRVAERRTESADLFLRAGRAPLREILEAQEALVTARDAWISAVVAHRVAELALQRDLGILDVNAEGLWNEIHLAERIPDDS